MVFGLEEEINMYLICLAQDFSKNYKKNCKTVSASGVGGHGFKDAYIKCQSPGI